MKFITQTAVIIIFTLLLQLFLPWWSLMIGCFLVSFFIYGSRTGAFFSGLLGVAILWISYAAYIDNNTSSILTEKVAQIFSLPPSVVGLSNTVVLILITGLIGGISGAFSSLSGHLFREFFTRKPLVD